MSANEPHIEPLDCSAVLTHHWLVRVRGGEKVLAALTELLPDSPLYTLVYDRDGVADTRPFDEWRGDPQRVKASLLRHIPGATRYYPKLLPLLPWAARRMHLPPVELVVCSDAAIAKAMSPDARSKVVCYCHSPMRYVWEDEISREYCATLPAPLRPLWRPLVARLQQADHRAAQRVDQFVANSRHVAARIQRHYGRDALVVHPPVDLPPAPVTQPREDFYLCVGHHVPYKRLDLAVEACRQLGRRLVVIGSGPDVARLRPRSGEHVTWLGWQSTEAIHDHYRRARALLFPGEEDFGIVPVEAMAHGCPVNAFGVGGATETVVPGETGLLFDEQTADALVASMQSCEGIEFDPVLMHERMQRFRPANFLRQMREILTDVLAGPPRRCPTEQARS